MHVALHCALHSACTRAVRGVHVIPIDPGSLALAQRRGRPAAPHIPYRMLTTINGAVYYTAAITPKSTELASLLADCYVSVLLCYVMECNISASP